MSAGGCGHPNHGNTDHDCTPFLAFMDRPDRQSLEVCPCGLKVRPGSCGWCEE